MIKKKDGLLPHPELKRLPVVEHCLAAILTIEETKYGKTTTKEIERPECNKVFRIMDEMDHGNAESNIVCEAYENPAKMWKRGCPLASNIIKQAEEAIKINPLKASKRAKRKG